MVAIPRTMDGGSPSHIYNELIAFIETIWTVVYKNNARSSDDRINHHFIRSFYFLVPFAFLGLCAKLGSEGKTPAQ